MGSHGRSMGPIAALWAPWLLYGAVGLLYGVRLYGRPLYGPHGCSMGSHGRSMGPMAALWGPMAALWAPWPLYGVRL